jgi:outer membrane protein TolC
VAGAQVESLGFEDAVRRALERNPTVEVAQSEIERARALVEQARSTSLPTLSANATYTHLDGDRKLDGVVILPQDQINANLLLSVPLVQTRGWVQWSHAKDSVDVARLSAAEVKRQLAIAVARTYLSVIAQRRVLEVTERSRATADAHFKFAHQRFAGGYGTRVDEARAAQELATDVSHVEAATGQLTRLREALGVLVGADHALDAGDEPAEVALPAVDQALREAEDTRTDVKLQKRRLEAATRVVRDDWADYLPSLVGSLSPFFQDPITSTIPEQGWQALLMLTWPLYDGGLRYGLAKERAALEHEAQAQLEGTRRQAAADVRAADEDVRRQTASLAAAQSAGKYATDALSLTTLAYRAGASTNIEVIDAERQARDAETAVAVAEDAYRQAVLDMLIATGRFPEVR